jgi:hypothetical protein
MLSFLTPYLFWIKLAGVVIALAGAGYVGHYVTKAVDDRAYAALELSQAHQQTADVQGSLDQLQGFISTMHAADAGYTASLDQINSRFATVAQELNNAIHLKPLPLDCKPDAGRVRQLSAAIIAANAGNSVPGK